MTESAALRTAKFDADLPSLASLGENNKGKFCPTTVREGPEEELRYIFTLSLTSTIDGVGVNATTRPLFLRENPVSIVWEEE
jgi:hypothetical protein